VFFLPSGKFNIGYSLFNILFIQEQEISNIESLNIDCPGLFHKLSFSISIPKSTSIPVLSLLKYQFSRKRKKSQHNKQMINHI